MAKKLLEGKKIAVIIEHKFIPEEINAYQSCFALLGAEVDIISRIYYSGWDPDNPSWKPVVFYSDVDPTDQQPWQGPESVALPDNNDVSTVNLDSYAAVIMAANYVSVRLRYPDDPSITDPRTLVQSPPVVRLFAEAMSRPTLVKGALCHGLWILTPHPELLKGRKVTCHTVVMADILNCGAEIVYDDLGAGKKAVAKVAVDHDLVTGFSKHEVVPFVDAIATQIHALSGTVTLGACR